MHIDVTLGHATLIAYEPGGREFESLRRANRLKKPTSGGLFHISHPERFELREGYLTRKYLLAYTSGK